MRMKRIAKELAVLAAVLVISLVGMAANGCGSTIHKASVAVDAISIGLQTTAQVNGDLFGAGGETLDERQQVALAIHRAAKANDTLTNTLKAAAANGTQLTPALILADFNVLADAVNDLEANGVLKISNPASRAKLEEVLGAIKAQIAIIQALIGAQASNASPSHGLPLAPLAPLAPLLAGGLVVTPALIEELAVLAAQLVSKVEEMRAATDEQLQADALANDATAEKIAEADEGPQ